MTLTFAQTLQQDRRLVILRLLSETGGALNESVIRDGLMQLGHTNGVTADLVREELRFLDRAGCITIEWFGDTVMVAKLTRRGVDCAAGAIKVEGVKRPSLGA